MSTDSGSLSKSLATRRSSATIPPLKIHNSAFLQDGGEEEALAGGGGGETPSPPGTPNSISGLIKGKWTSMSIPSVLKKKKGGDYKVQIFVAILFLTVILLVGSIYVIHKEKQLHKAYFEQIRFSPKDRKIRVVNNKGKEGLHGILGVNLTKKDREWPCLAQDLRLNSTCMEWMNKGRLYFEKALPRKELDRTSIRCYQITWEALSPSFQPKDCYYMTPSHGYNWYGGGEMHGASWPLNRTRVPFQPYLTGEWRNVSSSEGSEVPFQFGRVLSRSFINSHGGSIRVSSETPLHVSMNEVDSMLCIGADRSGFLKPGPEDPVVLNYTICVSDNIREMNYHSMNKFISQGLLHEDVKFAKALTSMAVWQILPQFINSSSDVNVLLKHSQALFDMGISEGYILLGEFWQRHVGDMTMDTRTFPSMSEALNITRRRGFKVALTISPFVSTESTSYSEGLARGVWLWEKGRRGQIPAHTRYDQWNSVTVLDSSSSKGQQWLTEKVDKVVSEFGVAGLWADVATSHDFPQFYAPPSNISSSDDLGKYFVDTLSKIKSVSVIGASGSVHLPKVPTFVSMSPTESSWQGLQSVIPNILSLGVGGYPFIMPGAIGGDYFPPPPPQINNMNMTSNFTSFTTPKTARSNVTTISTTPAPNSSNVNNQSTRLEKPDRSLFIRWMALAHFLPVVHYSYLPSDYDQAVVDIAIKFRDVRKSKVDQYIKKTLDESIRSGLPMIRPLWALDPSDANCIKISDEFMIGTDILVAPILKPGINTRDIYLPKGKWRNEMDGSNTKGEKWLHSVNIRQDQIAFFTRDGAAQEVV